MKEIWKDIEEFEGYYQISNLGQVKSMDRDVIYSNGVIRHYEERIRTPVTDKNGYLMVTLNKSSKSYPKRVHQLVARAFIPNPDNLPSINHIDEDKTNNRVDNLEWCSVYYNNHYNGRYERIKRYPKSVCLFNVVNGEVIKIESISDAARRLHGSAGNIEEVIDAKGRTFKGWMIFSERNFNGLAIKQSLEEYNKHRPRGIVVEFIDTEDKRFYATENEFCHEYNEHPGSINTYLRNNRDVFKNKYVIRYALPFEESKYQNGQLLDY